MKIGFQFIMIPGVDTDDFKQSLERLARDGPMINYQLRLQSDKQKIAITAIIQIDPDSEKEPVLVRWVLK